jgi:hypothetical protein
MQEAVAAKPFADLEPACARVEREAVLAAWAITLDGHKVLLALALGNRESSRGVAGVLAGSRRPGSTVPL